MHYQKISHVLSILQYLCLMITPSVYKKYKKILPLQKPEYYKKETSLKTT